MRTRLRQHPGATWFAVILTAAIVLVVVFASVQVFHKANTPPQTTNASLRLGPGTAPTTANHALREGATATAIAAGDYATCALVAGATADCWGDGAHGQLGNGAKENSLVPAPVHGLPAGVTSIAAGGSHACAVLKDGSVECWGAGAHGALGDGSTADAAAPVPVRDIHTAIAVAAGVAHTCALLRGGTVECWGANSNGQLGDGTTTDKATPVAVTGLSGATGITAGLAHTCAIRSGGTIDCWGSNSNGQLGDGKTLDSPVPVAVTGLGGAASAVDAGDAHTCALLADGSIDCWGWNIEGQLGNGGGDSSTPVAVAGIRHAMALTTGGSHTCTLVRSGAVECWGANLYGQLGNGTTSDSSSPVAVPGLASGVTAVSAGLYDTCALLNGGSATCWGWNAQGQLGNNNRASSTSPVSVSGLGLAPDGSGSVSASPAALQSSAKHATISFTYTAAAGGIHSGALAVVVPFGWSLPSTAASDPGFTTATKGRVVTSGRTIRVLDLTLGRGEGLTIRYGSTEKGGPGALAKRGGTATWRALEQSSASGTLSPLLASPRIAVLAPDGSGTLTTPTVAVPNGDPHRTLGFTYTPQSGGLLGGTVTVGVPSGWSPPTTVPSGPGYATASSGIVTANGRTITVSGLHLSSGKPLTITYRGGKVPGSNVGTQTWSASETSGAGGKLMPLAASPAVTVLSASGSGHVDASLTTVPNGGRHLSITFQYIADTGGLKNGSLAFDVPAGWSAPSTDPHAPGYVSSARGKVGVAGRRVSIPVQALASGDSRSIVYGSTDGGGPGATAPVGQIGPQQWTSLERSLPSGRMKALATPTTITVLSPDGSGTLARATGTATPGSHGNTIAWVFVAAPGGISDGELELTAPSGWTAPSTSSKSSGYVSASPGTVAVHGQTITVSHLSLAGGATVTIVYGSRAGGGPGADAPGAQSFTQPWPARLQSSPNGHLSAIKQR
jgi:alpha-tubulin suppressor-like RCC1 family protein